jgi:hypothetical protein
VLAFKLATDNIPKSNRAIKNFFMVPLLAVIL